MGANLQTHIYVPVSVRTYIRTYIYSSISSVIPTSIHTRFSSRTTLTNARQRLTSPPGPQPGRASQPPPSEPASPPASRESRDAPRRRAPRGRRRKALTGHEGEITGRPLRAIEHQCKNETGYSNGVFMSGWHWNCWVKVSWGAASSIRRHEKSLRWNEKKMFWTILLFYLHVLLWHCCLMHTKK